MAKLGNTTVVHIRVDSEGDDCTYEGDFTIKRQGIMDYSRQQLRKLELNGGRYHVRDDPGAGVPWSMEYFNEMISTLEITVLKAPDWWDLEEISDFEVMDAVYKEVTAFEATFLNRKRNQVSPTQPSVGNSAADSSTQRGSADATASSDSVVGKEIPPALQP